MYWDRTGQKGMTCPFCFQPKVSDILRLFFWLKTGILRVENEIGKERVDR